MIGFRERDFWFHMTTNFAWNAVDSLIKLQTFWKNKGIPWLLSITGGQISPNKPMQLYVPISSKLCGRSRFFITNYFKWVMNDVILQDEIYQIYFLKFLYDWIWWSTTFSSFFEKLSLFTTKALPRLNNDHKKPNFLDEQLEVSHCNEITTICWLFWTSIGAFLASWISKVNVVW